MKEPKKVVLLNGPSGSGKDTIASHLVPYFSFQKMKFAAPIKRMAAALLDMDVSRVEQFKEDEFNILSKEILIQGTMNDTYELGPKDTLRRFLIRLSEDFLKPTYGDTFFGRIATRELRRSSYSLIIFTDSGFASEADVVIREVGRDNTILCRLHRDGCSYERDSRNYLSDIAGRCVDIENNGTIAEAVFRVAAAIRGTFGIELLKEMEM